MSANTDPDFDSIDFKEKPDYELVLQQIGAEKEKDLDDDPNTVANNALIETLEDQSYVFPIDDPRTEEDETINDAEIQLFEYTDFDYFVDNPGYTLDEANNFISYVGTYFNQNGDASGEVPES
jgi:hypothetical protein